MHVLIIPSEEFIPEYAPGAGIFQYHQAKIIQQAGFKVGVLSVRQTFTVLMIIKALLFKCLNKKSGNKCDDYSFIGLIGLLYNKMYNVEKYIRTYEEDGLPVVAINGFYYKRGDEHAMSDGWVKAGKAAYEKYCSLYGKPDVIHAHNVLNAGFLANDIYSKNGVPYLLTEHSSDWVMGAASVQVLKNNALQVHKESKQCFAVSTDFANKLNATFGFDKVKVLPNVLDVFLEKKEISLSETKNEHFTFLHIAEFKPVKDQATLLKAFAKVLAINPNVKLRIGGDGILEDDLRHLVKELEIEEHVSFLGWLNREDVFKEIASCDCFVMCSLYETFCVVLIEALLFGKPVIATRSGGPIDIVQQEVGLLVDVRSPDALSQGMQRMIDSVSNYQPAVISQYVIDKYGAEQFANEVSRIYKEVLTA